jgi:hypothetical protein
MGWCETVWRCGRSSKTVCNLNLGLLLYNGLGPGVVGVGLGGFSKRVWEQANFPISADGPRKLLF